MARGPLLLAIFTTVALASVVSAQATTSDGPAQVTAPADRRGPPRSLLVSAGGDTGQPIAIEGSGIAADEFRSIAEHIATELAPPVAADDIDMAGCSVRLFDSDTGEFDVETVTKVTVN